MVEDFKNTDAGKIPNDWNAPLLSEISDFENGKAHEQFIDDKGDYIVVNSKFISQEGRVAKYSKENLSPLAKGSIAIVMSDIPNGKALAKCFSIDKDNRYTLNQRIGSIIPFDEVDNDYLFYKLNRNKYFLSFDSGTGQTNIKKSEILACPVALPPTKEEQTAIATAIKNANELILQLEKLISKKIAIKNEISRDLLSGNKRLDGSSEKWDEVTIEKLCKTFTKQTGFDYSAHIKPKLIKHFVEGVIPFIQNKDFNGFNVNFNTDYFIPLSVAKDFPRILLDEKCLLISISGSIGNVGVFNNNQIAFLGGAIAVAKFHNRSLIDWAMYYLKSPDGQNMMVAKVKTGSHQNLILDDIRKMLIPIPPKEEMQKIVTILYDMDIEIVELENKLGKYKMLKQGMMQSLLTGKIRLV